jgi:WD40 repeat protein
MHRFASKLMHVMHVRIVQGEINDIKINANCAQVATCATDGYIRVWSLQKSSLSEPVATFQCGGNTYAVFLHWHPQLPNVLAYANGSGSACCVWDTSPGGGEIALRPSHAFAAHSTGLSRRALVAAAAGQNNEGDSTSLAHCSWKLTYIHPSKYIHLSVLAITSIFASEWCSLDLPRRCGHRPVWLQSLHARSF